MVPRLPKSSHFLAVVAVSIGAMMVAARPAAAQAGVLQGEVVDYASGAPVAAARVMVDDRPRALADSAGRFRVEGLSPGEHVVRVERLGYAGADLVAGMSDTLRVTVELVAVPQPMEAVRVTARAPLPEADAGPPEFEFRRAHSRGSGHFLTRADIERAGPGSLADLLRRIPGARIVHERRLRGDYLASAESAGPGTLTRQNKACYTQIIVNHAILFRMGQGDPPNLNAFPLAELQAIEYYGHGSSTPSEFRAINIDCGTLVLWTRTR